MKQQVCYFVNAVQLSRKENLRRPNLHGLLVHSFLLSHEMTKYLLELRLLCALHSALCTLAFTYGYGPPFLTCSNKRVEPVCEEESLCTVPRYRLLRLSCADDIFEQLKCLNYTEVMKLRCSSGWML
jgi:hypothetical protein